MTMLDLPAPSGALYDRITPARLPDGTLDHDAWLRWRQQGIGGSDVAAILGLSPWTSSYSLWCDKLGLLPPQDATDAMEFGKRAERMLAEWFYDRTGLAIVGEQTWLQRVDHPWMRATADGFVVDLTAVRELAVVQPDGTEVVTHHVDALSVAELKTTSSSAAEWAEGIPPHYVAQATWLAAITGERHVTFPTLHLAFGRVDFQVWELVVTDADVEHVMAKAAAWWRRHIVDGVPPRVDGSDATARALDAQYPADKAVPDQAVDLTSHHHVLGVLASIRAEQRTLKAAEVEVANRLKALLGDSTVGTVQGERRLTWDPYDTERLDVKALRERLPRVAARFTTTTQVRPLKLVAPSKTKTKPTTEN